MFSDPIAAALAADKHKTMIEQAEAARLAREFRELRRRGRSEGRADRGALRAAGLWLRSAQRRTAGSL
jgi:hypothetical protein